MAFGSSIIAKLGLDSSAFTTGLSTAGVQVERFAASSGRGIGSVVGSMGKLVSITGAVKAALGTLIGIGATLSAPALGEALARRVTGFSKEAEKSLEDMVAATGKAADEAEKRRDKAREAREAREEASLASRADDEIKQYELVRDFKLRIAEEDAAEEKRRAADLAEATARGIEQSVDLDQRLWRQRIDRLPTEQKINALERERAELIQVQRFAIKGSNDYKEMGLKIGELDNEIARERAALARVTATAAAKITQEQRDRARFAGSIDIRGRANDQLSPRELESKIAALQADIQRRQLASNQGGVFTSASTTDPLLALQGGNLSAALAEQQLRRSVQHRAEFAGEDRAFRESGLDEQRFRQILDSRPPSNEERTVSALERLTRLFEEGRARVAAVNLN